MRAAVTVNEMRNAEAEAATRGLSEIALMQLAGHGAATWIAAQSTPDDRFLVLVGPGNNGGDALVAAATLRTLGASLRIATFRRAAGDDEHRADPPGTTTLLAGCLRFECTSEAGQEQLASALSWCTVIIDGLLGTGRSRPPDDALRVLLQAVNRTRQVRVIALDVPTGVDADSGQADHDTIKASATLVFGYMKRGLLFHPARAMAGALHLVDIGLPSMPRIAVSSTIIDQATVAQWLPERPSTVQKYSAGAVLAVAGSPHYVGAPVLTCRAALRCGAGYVTLAISAQAFQAVAGQLLEATMLLLTEEDALKSLQDAAGRYRVLLIGPGLGRDEKAVALVREVLSGALEGPTAAVVDADALFALASTPDWQARVRLPLVLTPHTGEMARLIGMQAAAIERDRVNIAMHYAETWKQVLVLKGSPTVVADPHGNVSINTSGNALLATAGTGDVLTGCVAALLAAGAEPYDAARAAVYVHGLAADLAQAAYGDRGMLAGDLLDLLPRAIKHLRSTTVTLHDAGARPLFDPFASQPQPTGSMPAERG